MRQAGALAVDPRLALPHEGGPAVAQPFGAVVEALGHVLQQALWIEQTAGEAVQALPPLRHHARGGAQQAALQLASLDEQLAAHRHRDLGGGRRRRRSEEHTSELQSLMRISYAVFCLKQKNTRIYCTTPQIL